MAESGEVPQRLTARVYRRMFIDPEATAETEAVVRGGASIAVPGMSDPEATAETEVGGGGGASIAVPGMRNSPLTRGRKRDPDRLLPFRFSSWITGEIVEMVLPDNFREVHYANCPGVAKIRFTKTGRVYLVSVVHDETGTCFLGEGTAYLVSSIEAVEGDRLDFTYNGNGKFDVSIGDDSVKTSGEKPYTKWEEALATVRRKLE